MADKPTFVTLSSVKALKVDWLWKPYIPFGMITILEGDPGLGKSFLLANCYPNDTQREAWWIPPGFNYP